MNGVINFKINLRLGDKFNFIDYTGKDHCRRLRTRSSILVGRYKYHLVFAILDFEGKELYKISASFTELHCKEVILVAP